MQKTLSNGQISVTVDSAGGSIASLRDGEREYLWQGDPAVWSGQAPICFPICGGLRDGRAVTESGRTVTLARHGFARKQEWQLLDLGKAGDTEAALELVSTRLTSTPELFKQYPFDFELTAHYALEGRTLHVDYDVTNTGSEPMPFFIGGHPGFCCPLDEGEAYDDYELLFEKDEASQLCTAVPSTGLIDVENRSSNPMHGRALPLSRDLFGFAETIFDVLESRSVTLTKKNEAKGVRVTFKDFPYLIVWGKPEGDFVAIEPWGGLSTCSDEDDVLEHKRGCLVAQPGQTVTRGFQIQVL